jgi:hypothetical protein
MEETVSGGKPITPAEAAQSSESSIPAAVFMAFNKLLGERYDRGGIHIDEKEVVALILKGDPALTADELYKRKWLDVEPLYRKAGWKVDYDKPGYNETYDPSWTFTPKR